MDQLRTAHKDLKIELPSANSTKPTGFKVEGIPSRTLHKTNESTQHVEETNPLRIPMGHDEKQNIDPVCLRSAQTLYITPEFLDECRKARGPMDPLVLGFERLRVGGSARMSKKKTSSIIKKDSSLRITHYR